MNISLVSVNGSKVIIQMTKIKRVEYMYQTFYGAGHYDSVLL